MPVIRVNNLDRRKSASCVLDQYARKVFSQFGEDGIIERVFEIIDAKNKWCVEFGAWDGVYLSNTCNLIRNHGWSAVQIEGNPRKFLELEKNFKGLRYVKPLQRIIGFTEGKDTIDHALSKTRIPEDFDLISIDIDGNDYHIWRSMTAFKPRAVVIEFNPAIPNDVEFIQDRDMAIHQGASLAALIELGKRKDYELVATTNCNAVFVRQELFRKFGISDNSIDAMRKNITGRIFSTYDGTIYNNMRPLQWVGRGTRVPNDQFQMVQKEQRVFYDNIPEAEIPVED